MNKFSLFTELSPWYIVICLITGALYASVLYYKNTIPDISTRLHKMLWAFRFVVITFIALLLLNPFVKSITKEVQRPIVVVGVDNSESISLFSDSVETRKKINIALDKINERLSPKFEIKYYLFGNKVQETKYPNLKDKTTDISSFFSEIASQYCERNLGAVLLFSDGIYNRGSDPILEAKHLNVPIYSIMVGDTIVRKDLIVKDVVFNNVCFAGNSFPVEVYIQGNKAKGNKSMLTIEENDVKVGEKLINFDSDNYFQKHSFVIKAGNAGSHKYTVKIQSIEGERILVNNSKTIYVDVLEGKQKILIVYDAPHPDVACLKRALETNANYEVEVSDVTKVKNNVTKYDLIILNQMPANNTLSNSFVKQVINAKVPSLFIVGEGTALNNLNSIQVGVNVVARKLNLNDAQAVGDKNFSLFSINDATQKFLSKMPPMKSIFGSYKLTGNAGVLAYQKVGAVITDMPLIAFSSTVDQKIGYVFGEGIWQWRMFDYAEHGNSNITDELILKISQYLAVKADKSMFRVKTEKKYFENEAVTFDGELYNDSYELINEPEVALDITSQENKKYTYAFEKTATAYRLNVGMLKPGDYNYKAHTKLNNKQYEAAGKFTIMKLDVEAADLTANSALMYTMASKTKGKYAIFNNVDKIIDDILKREDLKPVAYQRKKTEDIINLKWLFFLILSLVSVEWFVRKYNGNY